MTAAGDNLFGSADAVTDRLQQPLATAFEAVHPAWRALTQRFLGSRTGQALCAAIDRRRAEGEVVLPPQPLRALANLAPGEVQVVILGQDPYHGAGQAEGLAFSVPPGVRLPPSLRNVFKERQCDIGLAPSAAGHLGRWCEEGVLLLNASLTVALDQAASHARLGWQAYTDAVIEAVAQDTSPKVFMLWGAHAQAKQGLIQALDRGHLVLCANHPSPLSALRPPVPFIGSAPFSRANDWLLAQGRQAIDWSN